MKIQDPVHALEIPEVLRHLQTSREGLTRQEAADRLERYGPNALREQRSVSRWEVFCRQFRSTVIYVLVIAGIAAALLGEAVDATAIFLIVGLIGVVGFLQEWRAEEAVAALRRMLTHHARVQREGVEAQIDARELVPGDIILLSVGGQVPADVRLLEAVDLRIDESALTGESSPVHKGPAPVEPEAEIADRRCLAYMGTVVTAGWGLGVVTATGQDTELGRIAQATQEVRPEPTPLQRQLETLGRQVAVLALIAAGLVAAAGVFTGLELLETIMVGIAVAVAAIPEGLPAIVTLTLALGARHMARRKALLRRMAAAEGLGAATTICSDKTRTITKGEMTVTSVWVGGDEYQVSGVGYAPEGALHKDSRTASLAPDSDLSLLLTIGMRCNHARLQQRDGHWEVVGDPTEGALLTLGAKAGLDRAQLQDASAVGEFSFGSSRKRMTVLFEHEQGTVAYTKGAPEVLLERASALLERGRERPLEDADRKRVEAKVTELSSEGLRTLAFAYRKLPAVVANGEHEADEVERDLVFVGVVGMMDPPRPEAIEAVKAAYGAGIDVIMITGDNPLTAQAVGKMVGIVSEHALRGNELDRLTDEELAERLKTTKVLARVSPEHKLRVARLLRQRGEIVAMTGDGVNDAPALREADVGVAMGMRGTDVAKGASDMVLTDDNFASIVSAIEEGRRQFDNIEKFVRYLLSANGAEVLAVVIVIAMGYPLILLPVQILWINLVSDSLPALSLGVEPAERDVMRRRPRNPKARILSFAAGAHIGFVALLVTGGVVGLFLLALANGASEAEARTMAFTTMVVLSLRLFSFRSLRSSVFSLGLFRNPAVLVALLAVNSLQLAVVYLPFFHTFLGTVPLRLDQWLMAAGYALFVLVVAEVSKVLLFSRWAPAPVANR